MFVFSIKVSLLSKHKQIQIVNKIKYFILTFLSVFLTFINSSAIDNIKLNASSSSEIMFMEKISDNYFTEKSVDKGFVEDFICSQ